MHYTGSMSSWPESVLALFDVGGGEFFLILFVALLLFGGKLPDVARSFGKTIGEFKRTASNLTREFRYDDLDRPPPRPPRMAERPPQRTIPRTPLVRDPVTEHVAPPTAAVPPAEGAPPAADRPATEAAEPPAAPAAEAEGERPPVT